MLMTINTMGMLSFKTHLESVIRPAAKLHVAVLVVKGEPSDVDLAGGLEDARGDVGAHTCLSVCQGAHGEKPLCLCTSHTLARNDHVCVVRPVESLVSTEVKSIIVLKLFLFCKL